MDQFAFHDIPDSIDYILETTSQPSLSYIGFSQGTAQAFATLSIHPTLNEKVDVFIALAPAMSPAGLSNGVVNALIKTSPEVIFLAFGRRSILSSATMWQALLYPPIFVRIIDMSLSLLFGWSAKNISTHQKLAAYPHLYSFTSTKSVVHWFQIIRNKSFQMYDDELQAPLSLGASNRYYKAAKFPTRNIKTPIVLVYGGSDNLVDIKVMLKELPRHTVAKEIPHFEHLDFLWAQDVDTLVFPYVFAALEEYAGRDHLRSRPFTNKVMGKGALAIKTSAYSDDDISFNNTGASDAETDGSTIKSYAAAGLENPSTPVKSSDNPSPPSTSSTNPTSLSVDGPADSPTPAGPKPASVSLTNNTMPKRGGSPSSAKSLDSKTSITRFGDSGISIGPAKAIVGGVSSPNVREAGRHHEKDLKDREGSKNHASHLQSRETGTQHGNRRHSREIGTQHGSPRNSREIGTQHESPRNSREMGTQHDSPRHNRETGTQHDSPRHNREAGTQHASNRHSREIATQHGSPRLTRESGSGSGTQHGSPVHTRVASSQHGSPIQCSPAVPAVDFAKH